MMMDLGTLSVSAPPSFNEARRKVLKLADILGFSVLEATRLTSLLSEAVRPAEGKSTRVSFRLVESKSRIMLEAALEYSGETASVPALGSFFETPPSTAKDRIHRLRKALPLGATMPDHAAASAIREMLALPSREELLLILEGKNKALQRSEARIQAALESAPDPLLMITPDDRIAYANSMAVSTFGYAKDELLGRSISMLVPERIRSSHPDRVKQFFAENRTRDFSMKPDLHVVCKDGSRRFVDIKLSPLQTEDGMRAIAAIRDVTVQLKAQQQRDEALEIVKSSINYASRIQRSILPEEAQLAKAVSEHFVLWKPRDVVGGDIYWAREWGEGTLLILADCTGHGVPGAFITLIASGALDIALNEAPPGDPAGLFQHMHRHIRQVLSQHVCADEAHRSDDGLELGACFIPKSRDSITFAGAGFPLFICSRSGAQRLRGDRKGIGYRGTPQDAVWTNRSVTAERGASFYMGSDGIFDQIGGSNRRGFGKKRFVAMLESIQSMPLREQGEAIYRRLQDYQGDEKRRDDVSAIGFRL